MTSILPFLPKRLYPNNVLGIRAFADTLACWSLVEACNRYLQKHFVDVSMSEEFLSLPLPDVRDIISRDELNVQSEENVSVRMVAMWQKCGGSFSLCFYELQFWLDWLKLKNDPHFITFCIFLWPLTFWIASQVFLFLVSLLGLVINLLYVCILLQLNIIS